MDEHSDTFDVKDIMRSKKGAMAAQISNLVKLLFQLFKMLGKDEIAIPRASLIKSTIDKVLHLDYDPQKDIIILKFIDEDSPEKNVKWSYKDLKGGEKSESERDDS